MTKEADDFFNDLKSPILLPQTKRLVFTKPGSNVRWSVLILSCIMLLGSYYCFDIPSALKTQIGVYMGDPADEYETYFALMYTVYAVPNAILPFFGGYFVDTFGVCVSLLVCTIFLAAGQTIVALGFTVKSWYLILTGRFVFALGGENLIVASSALLADWFMGKELAFSFGVNLSIARVGSVINNVASPLLTKDINILFAMWMGAFVCGVSVISVLMTMPIDAAMDAKIAQYSVERYSTSSTVSKSNNKSQSDTHTDKQLALSQDSAALLQSADADGMANGAYGSLGGGGECDEQEEKELTMFQEMIRDSKALPHLFWVLIAITLLMYGAVLPFNNVASSLLLERNYFLPTPADCPLHYGGQCQSAMNQPNCTIPANYAPPLPTNITIGGVNYASVTAADVDCTSGAWTDCVPDYCKALSGAEGQAAVIMSIPYIISGAASPFFGIFIDKFGLRAALTAGSAAILIVVHVALGYMPSVGPVAPLVGQGLAYTCFSAVLWPAIPLVVEEKYTGLAFGIGTAAYNAGCAVLPLVVAAIYTDAGNLYIPNVENLFIAIGCLSFILGMYLNYYDYYHFDSVLNKGLEEGTKDEAIAAAERKAQRAEAEGIGFGFPAAPVYLTANSMDGRDGRDRSGSLGLGAAAAGGGGATYNKIPQEI